MKVNKMVYFITQTCWSMVGVNKMVSFITQTLRSMVGVNKMVYFITQTLRSMVGVNEMVSFITQTLRSMVAVNEMVSLVVVGSGSVQFFPRSTVSESHSVLSSCVLETPIPQEKMSLAPMCSGTRYPSTF